VWRERERGRGGVDFEPFQHPQEALLRRFWKMNGSSSENQGCAFFLDLIVTYCKVFECSPAFSPCLTAEFLRKVLLDLRRELPQEGQSDLLVAVKDYLSESGESCVSRERQFADSLQCLVDKYQV
jgi:hypothetical protein